MKKNPIDGATEFLLKVSKDINPIPFPLFKSAIDKQIEWAANRGETLDFDTLAEAVKQNLERMNVQVMPNKFAKKKQNNRNWMPEPDPDLAYIPDTPDNDTFTLLLDDKQNTAELFVWFCFVLNKANAQNSTSIYFTAEVKKGDFLF